MSEINSKQCTCSKKILSDKQKYQFHLLDGKGKPCGVFDYKILEYIKRTHNLFIMAKTPYFYNNGAYHLDKDGTKLKTLIRDLILPKFIKSTTITRVYQLFLMDYELQKDYEDINRYPEYWICFKNGMYDVLTNELHEHRVDYYCINQIPWNYDPNKHYTGTITDKFFSEVMSDGDRKTIFQYLGLCMTRCNQFQKFILLKGSRGTGKSRVIRMFENILGKENCSNIALQKLEEKFYTINLLGKLVNMCADINASPMKTVNTIKLITGGDTLSDSFKGKDVICFEPYARLMFSCNTVPLSLDEKSNALFERIVIIEMDNRSQNPDRMIDEKLMNEAPYIIEKALEALNDLFDTNGLYESSRSKELVQELYSDCDSVTAFLSSCMENDKGKVIKTTELLEAYRNYCKDYEREPLSKTNFYRNVRGKGYGKVIIHGSEYFSGLGFKENDFMELSKDERIVFD